MGRLVPLALLAITGCAGADHARPEIYYANGEPGELAACAYEALRSDRTTRMAPLPGGRAELAKVVTPCGLLGCNAPRSVYVTEFAPDGPGRTRIEHREMLNLVRSGSWEGSGVGSAVARCASARPS